jgi:hypothetical protein
MGDRAETIAANSGGSEANGIGSGEAHNAYISPQENRGGTKGKVGEAKGGAEEGGLANWGACRCKYAAGFLYSSKQKRGTP